MIKITAWHDNTAANRANPDPTQWIGWGQRSYDDMYHAHVRYIELPEEDYEQMVQARGERRQHRQRSVASPTRRFYESQPASSSPWTHGDRLHVMKVGFIGLGIMGAPMAGHLQSGGHTLHVVRHRSAIPQKSLDGGAVEHDSLTAAARQADIIMTMVPGTPDVERVLFGRTRYRLRSERREESWWT